MVSGMVEVTSMLRYCHEIIHSLFLLLFGPKYSPHVFTWFSYKWICVLGASHKIH